IFANNHSVKLEDTEHRLVVNAADAARGREKGVLPQTAKEEQQMMRKLYMQSVLKQADAPKLVQLGSVKDKKEEGNGAVTTAAAS
ncbi:MAG TPA: hypothetical protein VFZ34_26725, partial [Blastocatellia bacterium]|nr:hypothetical protein [Blastocatellia bacterium]